MVWLNTDIPFSSIDVGSLLQNIGLKSLKAVLKQAQ
jgi:hypothetical protein